MLDAGLSPPEAVQALVEKESSEDLRHTLKRVADALLEGASFSAALARQPEVFPALYVATKAAEKTGDLRRSACALRDLSAAARRDPAQGGVGIGLSDCSSAWACWSPCSFSPTWCRASPRSTRISVASCLDHAADAQLGPLPRRAYGACRARRARGGGRHGPRAFAAERARGAAAADLAHPAPGRAAAHLRPFPPLSDAGDALAQRHADRPGHAQRLGPAASGAARVSPWRSPTSSRGAPSRRRWPSAG